MRGSRLSFHVITLFQSIIISIVLGLSPAHAAGPDSVADLAAGLIDAVVNISTAQTIVESRQVPMPPIPDGSPFRDFFQDYLKRQGQDQQSKRTVRSLGSGFVIDPSGLIVTNNHVIEDADQITAIFTDGTKRRAKLIGRDKRGDLAVLKVESAKPLAFVPLGESEKMRVGDWVMAIGNPFGLGGSVTIGIISARNRNINSGPYDNFLQTDAAINRGNSGGPLFNMKGEVIGINSEIISPSGGSIGIGFAIPTESARNTIDQLVQFGEVRRGWLGINIQEVTDDIATALKLPNTNGALIVGVTPQGPADRAQIQPGDVVTRFDSHEIRHMHDLPRFVSNTPIGKTVKVELIRSGALQSTLATVQQLQERDSVPPAPTAPADEQQSTLFGLHLKVLDDATRQKLNIRPNIRGVVIESVEPGSQAESQHVTLGETIMEVSQQPVATPADVMAVFQQQKKDGRDVVLFLIGTPSGELRYVTMRME